MTFIIHECTLLANNESNFTIQKPNFIFSDWSLKRVLQEAKEIQDWMTKFMS